MLSVNNAEWKQAEEMLYNWKIVELLIDGYHVQLQLMQDGTKLDIVVYVNGKIKWEWVAEDCEERSKFWCESHKSLLNKHDKKKMGLTKKEYERLKEKYPPLISYSPYFKSFRTLKSQFIKHNTNIEFLGVYRHEL